MKKRNLLLSLMLTTSMMCSTYSIVNVNAENTTQPGVVLNETSTVTGDYDEALSKVTFSKTESDGTVNQVHVSELLKAQLGNETPVVTGTVGENSVTFSDVQLKDVFIGTDYLNGTALENIAFYNMVNYYTDVLQIIDIMEAYPNYNIIDNKGNTVDLDYVNELAGLINQILTFDTSTNLKYDYDSVYNTQTFENDKSRGGLDVIATSNAGNVTLRFHIDSHGWWGYDLGADDSITSLVMGCSQEEINADRALRESEITKKYGNFFVVELENQGPGHLYMLKNTDIENPMIYVSEDGKEAFMIDVDFYGENVINDVIKDVIGSDCESLKIFLTHNHGDHVNNLAVITKDEQLSQITSIYWPENEPHTVLNGVDLVTIFGEDKVTYLKDNDKIDACGHEFQFIEIPDEHTPGGGQLADLTTGILYSGDTLGAQVHLGGTTVRLSALDNWIAAAEKTTNYIETNNIKYIIGGHTGYLNTPEFATYVQTALNYAKEKVAADSTWKGLVVVRDNSVISFGDVANGVTDRDELKIASVNFINDLPAQTPEENPEEENPEEENPEEQNPTVTPGSEETKPDATPGETEKPADKQITNNDKTSVKTGDHTQVELMVLSLVSAAAIIVLVKKKLKVN